MIHVKVWCLPHLQEGPLQEIHKKIVHACTIVSGLEIKSESDLLVLFPKDMMDYGLGSQLLIEVGGRARIRTSQGEKLLLARALGAVFETVRSPTKIECIIDFIGEEPSERFYWNSWEPGY